jgi:FkbM family methyltransferase
MELIEHQLVSSFIPAHAKVLELGARFGTTSCALSRKVFEKGVVVSVEPDERVWGYLEHNRISHHCSFYIVHEPVGNSTVSIGKGNYETVASYSDSPQKQDDKGRPNFYTLSELEMAVGFSFDALLIDCEGCIDNLFVDKGRSLQQVLANVNVIIIEADNPVGPSSPCTKACVDYGAWIQRLRAVGFRVVHKAPDTKYKWIVHYVLLR